MASKRKYRRQTMQNSRPGKWSSGPALLSNLVSRFEESQWWARERLEKYQFDLLDKLLRHAAATVPFYGPRLKKCGWKDNCKLTPEMFREFPILTRQDLQQQGCSIYSPIIPRGHGAANEYSSSGSTGRPVTIKKTARVKMLWNAITIRECLWNKRDFSRTIAYIRYLKVDSALPPEGLVKRDWGKPYSLLYKSAPAYYLNIRSTSSEQLDWLLRMNPSYLVILPSAVESIARLSMERKTVPEDLRQICTIGEALSATTRDVVKEAWGINISDIYSATEADYIALQAPGKEYYLVQSETVYVEILDKNNNPCQPGETGRVIVTPLYNFATPLIRYEIGDYAEMGIPSDCGRGLHVINNIQGRTRNMLAVPGGDRRFPSLGFKRFNAETGNRIRQFQIIQKSLEQLTIYLVMDVHFSEEEEQHLIEHVHRSVKYPYDIEIIYKNEIPRSASGKFEQFRSEVSDS